LAAGDDATDEDLFAQLPASAWTIHVGPGRSRARYYVAGPDEMVELVSQLSDALASDIPSSREAYELPAEVHPETLVTGEIPLVASPRHTVQSPI
jgi:trehalose 6-phosphate synthase/phosphatase